MSGMLLSCADFPIIKQVADLLGFVMNILYTIFDKIGIANIGLIIIVFTLIIKLLMIPMTIKQQKTTKLSSLMSPELQAIRKKYAGKNDNASMMAMNNETRAVYEKYGTSPTGGCMPMFLQMIILLALYGVISAIPTHVSDVKEIYTNASVSVLDSMDEYNELKMLNDIMVENEIEGFKENKTFNSLMKAYYKDGVKTSKKDIYNLLSNDYNRQRAGLDTSKDAWAQMAILKDTSLEILDKVSKLSEEDWKKVRENCEEIHLELVNKYAEIKDEEIGAITNVIGDNFSNMEKEHNKISNIYTFAGIDLSRSPSQEKSVGVWWALLIPILSALTQWYSTHIAQKAQPAMEDNPMASSFKMMNIMFPLMSAWFCYSFASGLGLYWVIGSVFQIGQQFFINSYFEKVDVQDIIKANVEKQNKKLAKYGMSGQSISQSANYNAKSVKNETNAGNTEAKKTTYKQGGIASKANMVKEFNERNK
ncbi:MAG: YidC/Oxa1 family membrane protein insertase [Lachnospiraceae bacterium]|nr:YidC/Oxa1 family membrane protein insertase [Lachnospiraceae bacterium]